MNVCKNNVKSVVYKDMMKLIAGQFIRSCMKQEVKKKDKVMKRIKRTRK